VKFLFYLNLFFCGLNGYQFLIYGDVLSGFVAVLCGFCAWHTRRQIT